MTRPRPSEVIAGIRAVLADVIAPELTSDHAQSRLAEIRAVLAQIDWDNTAFAMKARALALAQALSDASAWVDTALPQPPGDETLVAYEDFANALGLIAIDAIERLDSHLELQPGDEAARRAHRHLLDAF
jgi:hypothetical protein